MSTPENKRAEGEMTLRVLKSTHAKFIAKQRETRLRSADDLVQTLLSSNTLTIPLPPLVRERWEAAAAEAGYPLDKWVGLVVEAYIAYGASPGRIEMSLGYAAKVLERAVDIITTKKEA